MGWLSKLGKIGLTIAPYVAAPFTGGASLAFAPAANKAVGAWNQKDAQKRYEQGLAPSSFDKYLGMAGDVAGMYGSMGGGFGGSSGRAGSFGNYGGGMDTGSGAGNRGGGFGGYGGTPSYFPSGQGGGWADTFGRIASAGMDAYGSRSSQGSQGPQFEPQQGIGPSAMPRNGLMPRGGFSYDEDPMNQYNQNNPNLSMALHQGRQQALKNQPWRSEMGIYPQYEGQY